MTDTVSSPDPAATVAERSGDRTPAGSAGRFTGWGRVGLLAAGDALSFLLFSALGLQAHNQASSAGIAGELGLVIATAFPFAAGWFLVSPFLHAYSRSHTLGALTMLRQTEVAWLCSWPVALVLRWIFSSDHRVPFAFALVILVVNAIFLGVWRSVFALIAERRS